MSIKINIISDLPLNIPEFFRLESVSNLKKSQNSRATKEEGTGKDKRENAPEKMKHWRSWLKNVTASMMAIDVRRVQLDSRQKSRCNYWPLTPQSAEAAQILFHYNSILFFLAKAFSGSWRRVSVSRKKSWFSGIHWRRPLSVCERSHCLLFSGEIIHRFPGVENSQRKLSKLFFLII